MRSKNGCLYQFVESHAMNPMHNNMQEASMDKCGTSFLLFKNIWHNIFLPFLMPGVTIILVAMFLRSGLILVTSLELGRKIKDVNDFNIIFIEMKSKNNSPCITYAV